jgi:uncharacterized membrane protein
MPWLDGLLALAAVAAALAVRPWRALPAAGPRWPWLAWWALLPLLWSADRLSAMPLAQALPGSCLLALMAGWPLAMLVLVPTALLSMLLAGMPFDDVLHRFVWLGVAPATLALGLGMALRRWLPNHLFIYILGRGFFATALANVAAGVASAALTAPPDGTATSDLMLARGLVAFGDAFLTGMMTAIFVAFRPHWLATYADRIYLPGRPDPTQNPGPGAS